MHGSHIALRGVGKGDSSGGALEGRREEEEEEEKELTAATAADRGLLSGTLCTIARIAALAPSIVPLHFKATGAQDGSYLFQTLPKIGGSYQTLVAQCS